jgi:tripeptide aminopeptidase
MDALLDRFCRYVRIDTTASEDAATYPSSPGQTELGRLLETELTAMKLRDVHQDEHGIVMGTIPGNAQGAPVIAWVAHLDTSPEASGAGVQPIVHRDYDGRDIVLPGDPTKVIRVAETAGLADLKARTLITSDGTTLLGADDKAGVAVIMEAAARLMARPELPRGDVRVVFTCDEEVGRGVDKVDLGRVAAQVGYTLDGEACGIIENETFSADLATVTVQGRNIHPGLACGKMINSIRLAAQFVGRLPWHRLSPERSAGREGFMHPYGIEGGVEHCRVRILLRSFRTDELVEQAEILRRVAAEVAVEHPGAHITVEVKEQYRNMVHALAAEPKAVSLAEKAMRRAGLEPVFEAVRGGTDGSRLSAMGLPTPNLSTGMYNYHSPLEYACLEEMDMAVRVLIELAGLWAGERASSPSAPHPGA